MFGTVERVQRLSPHMVRVVLGGDGLAGFEPTPFTDSYVNLLFRPPSASYDVPFDLDLARSLPRDQWPAPRRFTVRSWDPRRRHLTIDFVTHGDEGVAGRWAQGARAGDRLALRGPSGGYRPDTDAAWHLMIGDESALPAIGASLEQVPDGVPVFVVALVDGPADELDLPSPGRLHLSWLHRDANPGADDLLLRAAEKLNPPGGRVQAFVHGEAVETRAVRKHLLGERGIPREALSVSPYWRRRFTDERWREIKGRWLAEVEQDL